MRALIHSDHPRTSWKRSVIKSLLYRVISWVGVTAAAWLFITSGWLDMDMAGKLALFSTVEAVQSTIMYYLYERLWAHIDLNLTSTHKETI